jgi:hypothetical protein
MRLRCCAMLCAFATAGLADSAQDYFSKSFQEALRSPFAALAPKPEAGIPVAPGRSQQQLLPRILPQSRAVVAGPGECAIPLAQTPISKDRQFLIRRVPSDGASKADPMAAPKIPVCRE